MCYTTKSVPNRTRFIELTCSGSSGHYSLRSILLGPLSCFIQTLLGTSELRVSLVETVQTILDDVIAEVQGPEDVLEVGQVGGVAGLVLLTLDQPVPNLQVVELVE